VVLSLVFSAGICIEPSIPLRRRFQRDSSLFFRIARQTERMFQSNPTYLDGREYPALDAQELVIGITVAFYRHVYVYVRARNAQTLLEKLVSKARYKHITRSICTNYTVDDKDCSLRLSDHRFRSERKVYFALIPHHNNHHKRAKTRKRE